MSDKNIKLLQDEFVPFNNVGPFWQLPKSVAENEDLSLGAKVLYSVLVGLAGKRGTAWPKKETLRKYLGNPSVKTIYRWQRELVDALLIRVHQKGRGLSNNYYFLRHPILGNAYSDEFDGQPRYVYIDPVNGARSIKTLGECWTEFMPVVNEWLAQQKRERTPFPKPNWRYDQKDYHEIKRDYESIANGMYPSNNKNTKTVVTSNQVDLNEVLQIEGQEIQDFISEQQEKYRSNLS